MRIFSSRKKAICIFYMWMHKSEVHIFYSKVGIHYPLGENFMKLVGESTDKISGNKYP